MKASNTLIRRFRRATLLTLALSGLAALLVSSAVVDAKTSAMLTRQWYVQVLVAFACMAAFIWFSSPAVALPGARSLPVMGGYGIVVFLVGALAASAASMALYGELSIGDYVVKPLFWLGLFGAVPAFLLGLVGGVVLRFLGRREEAG